MRLVLTCLVLSAAAAFWTGLSSSPRQEIEGSTSTGFWSDITKLLHLSEFILGAEQNEAEGLPHSDFDKYLDYVVMEYKFVNEGDRRAFESATSILVTDTWLVDAEGGQICISSTQLAYFERLLPQRMLESRHLVLKDVHRAVLTTYPLHPVGLPEADFADTAEVLRYVQATHMPTTTDIGYSWEGRAVRVAGAVMPNRDHDSRSLVICGIQGREWAGISACLALLEDLPPNVAVLPLANPDGYEFSWNADRLWTKNRQPTSFVLCTGHNVAQALDGVHDANATPCSDSWAGRDNNMPLEARVIRDYAAQFDNVIEVHGSARGPEPDVKSFTVDGQRRSVISLPDYGTGHLMSKKHLGELRRQMLQTFHQLM